MAILSSKVQVAISSLQRAGVPAMGIATAVAAAERRSVSEHEPMVADGVSRLFVGSWRPVET